MALRDGPVALGCQGYLFARQVDVRRSRLVLRGNLL